MLINTAIYVRVSTEEQATEGFSIHAQKDKLTKYAEVSDYNIVDYYIDFDTRKQIGILLFLIFICNREYGEIYD